MDQVSHLRQYVLPELRRKNKERKKRGKGNFLGIQKSNSKKSRRRRKRVKDLRVSWQCTNLLPYAHAGVNIYTESRCLHCGQGISSKQNSQPVNYCSSFCHSRQQQNRVQNQEQNQKQPIERRTCWYCHETFQSRTKLFDHLRFFTTHQVDEPGIKGSDKVNSVIKAEVNQQPMQQIQFSDPNVIQYGIKQDTSVVHYGINDMAIDSFLPLSASQIPVVYPSAPPQDNSLNTFDTFLSSFGKLAM